MDCKITLDGEDFTLTLNEDEQSATLTDDYGEVVNRTRFSWTGR